MMVISNTANIHYLPVKVFSDNDIGSLAKMIFSNFGVETKVDSKKKD